MAAAIDSWDPLREATVAVLVSLPRPLAGYGEPSALSEVFTWALSLLRSPRQRESDAGARLISMLNAIYIVDQGWFCTLHPAVQVSTTPLPPPVLVTGARAPDVDAGIEVDSVRVAGDDRGSMIRDGPLSTRLHFIRSVVALLEGCLLEGRVAMVSACKRSFMHGPLLALRMVVTAFPWREVLTHPELVRIRSVTVIVVFKVA